MRWPNWNMVARKSGACNLYSGLRREVIIVQAIYIYVCVYVTLI